VAIQSSSSDDEGGLVHYRNAAKAFVAELAEIRSTGKLVTVRGQATHELLARTVTLERPAERFITVPGRRNDVFSAIAETMWVLDGRDDIAFLSRYLGRAPRFSDDHLTWRGGYGPRLRNWGGIDQIDEIRKLLSADPDSRRAVAVLFDPARDFMATLDAPCNNWLHFIIRDGLLHMNVTVRSNDILWGFSGINTFEWSVLHEMMAFWLGASIGRESFFISSLHLYDERIEQADRALGGFSGATGYEDAWVGARFETPWEDFASVMGAWFELEGRLAAGEDCNTEIAGFPDPLLRQFLHAISIKWAINAGASEPRQRELLDSLGHSDLAFALHEQLFRDSATALLPVDSSADWTDLRETITVLHRSKDAAYGDSWKKRGELISIAANLARKIDRIDQVAGGASVGREALLDTAVDLLVYAVKYETFLADQSADVADRIFGRTGKGFSDGPDGFEELLRARAVGSGVGGVVEEAVSASAAFNRLDSFLQAHPHDHWVEKLQLAQDLSGIALRLVVAVAASDREAVEEFRREFGPS
jgi:thymidylate synthase